MTYNVALHPNCHITFDKSQWKNQNSGKTTEEVVSFYKYPYLKIVDYIVKKGDNTSVVFISKVKLMGFEKGKGKIPDILKNSEVEVILGQLRLQIQERLQRFNFLPGSLDKLVSVHHMDLVGWEDLQPS